MLHVGFKNYIPKNVVIAITEYNAAPLKRARQIADEKDKLINCTQGRKTRSLIHLSEGFIVTSSSDSDTLNKRWCKTDEV